MKNLILLFICSSIGSLFAQETANLVIFSEQGEPFFAYINSVKQNPKASPNVKITDLPSEFVRVRIEFEDDELQIIDKNFMVQFGHELTARISKNRKGEYVLRPFSEPVPITTAPMEDDQPVIIYHSEPVEATAVEQPRQTERVQEPVSKEVHVLETTIEDDSHQDDSVEMRVEGMGIKMDVSISDPNGVETRSSNITTTTTTTTTTSPDRAVRPERSRRPEHRPKPVREEYEPVVEEVIHEPLVPGYNGPIGCESYMMSDQQFAQATKSISNKSFEDDKMMLAKQISANQCLTTAQVSEIMALFTFEETKLSWAKHAYGRTYDIGNYWMLNDGFTFSSSIDELNTFIESKR